MSYVFCCKDVYDRNMTIYDLPGTNGAWERRKQFGFPWSELAERVYITSNYQDFKNITQNYVIEKESIFTSKLSERERSTVNQ